MKIKKISDVLNESKIVSKDWDRMLDLVVSDENGENVSKSIKNKDKAISRFVSGLKLSNEPLNYNEKWKEYIGTFSSFGNKALSLGATPDEIEDTYDKTEVPTEYINKIKELSGKKLTNRFVSPISKTILDLGFDINYLKHNGNAITLIGKDAMSRNGRKWTIGYKTEILLDDKKFSLVFDAITDEGDGPTYYIVDPSSDKIFDDLYYSKIGIREFLTKLKNILNTIKK